MFCEAKSLYLLSSFECIIYIHMSGDYSKEVTPVPMPNTEVKLLSVDGSQNLRSARVERCQARNGCDEPH